MSITATELKQNLSKYIKLSTTEDVYITKNGKVVAVLSSPHRKKISNLKSLFGILPDSITLEEARAERLSKI